MKIAETLSFISNDFWLFSREPLARFQSMPVLGMRFGDLATAHPVFLISERFQRVVKDRVGTTKRCDEHPTVLFS
jgi:hypothetical protein